MNFQNPFRKNANWLWLILALPLVVLLAVSGLEQQLPLMVKVAWICSCSFICGFAVAIKSFSTIRQRIAGGLFFSGSSLLVISSVAFLGCIPLPSKRAAPAEIQAQRERFHVQRKVYTMKHVTPRDPHADANMLDLTQYYDELLPGQNGESRNYFHFLTPGIQSWNGIRFDVRGIVKLYWQGSVRGIPVKQKCSGIDFLHGTDWGWKTNSVAQFVIHFANGQSEIVPIIFGRDVSWSHLEMDSQRRILDNFAVWQESVTTNASPKPSYGFFIKRWANPFPQELVETVDFVSGETNSGAFLVAITLQLLAENK
jgi:hypothetical protein